MRACAHTRTLGALLHTHAYTLAHTPHICTHAPPSRASRALGCNLGSRSPHAAPDLHAPGPGCLARSRSAAAVPEAPRPQTHQAQALRTALHARPRSPARPAIPCRALRRPYKRQVSLRSGPAARGLCTCEDTPPRLGRSPGPPIVCSWRPSAAAGPESSLGPAPSGLCPQAAPSTQPLSWRGGATLSSRHPRGQNGATEMESPAGPWHGQCVVTTGSGTRLGTRLAVTTRGAPGIECVGPGMLLNTPRCPGRPHKE